jgi:transposase
MALSMDLRLRIVKAYLSGEGSYSELAARFDVGEASISRLLRRHRERGDVQRYPRGGGVPHKISPERYSELRRLIALQPDRTVDQLCHCWHAYHGVLLSRSAMQRTLKRAGMTWKKNGFVHQSKTDPTSRPVGRRSSKK